MSRLAKKPIILPSGVSASFEWGTLSIQGQKWKLDIKVHHTVGVSIDGNSLLLTSSVKEGVDFAQWWLTYALVQSNITWVSKWFSKSLEIIWVGYRVEISGSLVTLSVGFSHKVVLDIPSDVQLATDPQNANILIISGIDAQRVGEFAGKIRQVKTPEPYKGKGIRYVGEYVRRKAGKSWTKA